MSQITIGYSSINPYSYGYTNGYASAAQAAGNSATGAAQNAPGMQGSGGTKSAGTPTGIDPAKAGNGVEKECQTCKERKYQDGSNEMVSFKAATHISPEAAAVRVRAHEQEHVSNAYKKAAVEDAEVVRASVSIHTDICPECGRSYVSGGTTETQIRYKNEESPYQKFKKAADAYNFKGINIDAAV